MGVVYDQKTDVMGVEGRLVFSTDIDLKQPVAKARYIQPIFAAPRRRICFGTPRS
jgi:hypothetical protein